jgi:hypothetical protein
MWAEVGTLGCTHLIITPGVCLVTNKNQNLSKDKQKVQGSYFCQLGHLFMDILD